MKLLPYQRIHFQSRFNPTEINRSLSNLVTKPDWNISVDKVISNRIVEGKISNESFTVVMGRYGLTFGRTSLLPVMKGKVSSNELQGSEVDITIRPGKTGVYILGFFYVLNGLGLYLSISTNQPQGFVTCCIFFVITYYSLITKFNRESKVYREIIEKYLGPSPS